MLEIKAEMKLMAKSISVIQKKLDTSQSVLADDLPEDISLPISNAEELRGIEKKNWKWKAVDRIWYVVEIKTRNTFLY